jgi:quaternary ammonium compound-resistance protein SugE
LAWIYLLIAGLLEIGWIISLKHTEGFTRLVPIIFYALFGGGSAFFLSLSLKTIPASTAYAGWMGIAIIGTTLMTIFTGEEPVQFFRMIFIAMILAGVVGLKITSLA